MKKLILLMLSGIGTGENYVLVFNKKGNQK